MSMSRVSRDIVDVAVIGAGGAGLGVSYFLKRAGLDHLVLERSRIGDTWLSQRWDSFRLNSPNVRSMLPGDIYEGAEPLGAMTHHEFVAYLNAYVERNGLPVRLNSDVQRLTQENGCFLVAGPDETLRARTVVVATGSQNIPKRPGLAKELPGWVHQLDASHYRNAAGLDAGAVLVVGSAQSGGQIAEDLALAGRHVFLATSRTGRLVRRYRGGDQFVWLAESGFLDVPRRMVIRPDGRLPARGLQGATHTISLQSLSADGVVLLGTLSAVSESGLQFADNLVDHIQFADEASTAVKRYIDDYIERAGLSAPPAEDDPAETIAPRLPNPPILSLDWRESGIKTVVWCTGFQGDFGWVQIPDALDKEGQPLHEEGVSSCPGLFFAGLDFAFTRKSGTIPAIAPEAAALVNRIASATRASRAGSAELVNPPYPFHGPE
jgi:putative flavoprotein involved in K+ transport